MFLQIVLIGVLLMGASNGAPRSTKFKSTGPHTVYDQKQTGDYNIQLHLKDFQIIALLGEDAFSDADYEYNYDYSDFTVKPTPGAGGSTSSSTTTHKPPTTVQIVEKPLSASSFPTIKPSNHPYPIILPTNSSSVKPELNELNSTTVPPTPAAGNTTEKAKPSTVSAISTNDNSTTNSPGKIKVQILESPYIGIVPGEELSATLNSQNNADNSNENSNSPLGEILQYRKCLTGFTRDKKGRCRRVRRPGIHSQAPQLPFGIGRIASNLANHFRYASSDSSSSESSESLEQ